MRLAVIIAAAAAAIWLTVATGLAAYFRDTVPSIALSAMPGDARALSLAAQAKLLERPERPDFGAAAELARRAIDRDATLAAPFRVIGFDAEHRGNRKLAESLIVHADRLSRRDLATELWLIERAVARNDVQGALSHFDAALRTSEAAPGLLFPVLSNALSDGELFPAITAKLAQRPNWGPGFLVYAIQNNGDPSALASLLLRFRNWPEARTSELVPTVVASLLKRGNAKAARNLALAFADIQATDRLTVVDPGMTLTADSSPFAWSVADGNGVSLTGSEDGARFDFSADARAFPVSQLLALPPGRYRLATSAYRTGIDEGSIYWQVACEGPATQSLAKLPLPASTRAVTAATDFSVPVTGCRGQNVSLIIRFPRAAGEGLIRQLDIVPLASMAANR